MRYTECPFCKAKLHDNRYGFMICPQCRRSFRNQRLVPHVLTVRTDPAQGYDDDRKKLENKRRTRNIMISMAIFIPLFFILLIVSDGDLLGLAILLAFVWFGYAVWQVYRMFYPEKADALFPPGCGEKLRSSSDYLTQLRMMQLDTMPLGSYGRRAMEQIELLERQMQAIGELTGTENPFAEQTDKAAQFIYANCKQIIYRLKYGDQGDPAFRGIHEAYLGSCLRENDKVLHDFGQLILEVTQMERDLTSEAPCLDILADTLRDVRTYDGALPDPIAEQERLTQ